MPPEITAESGAFTVIVEVLALTPQWPLLVTVQVKTTVPTVPELVNVTVGFAAVVLEKLAEAPPVAT